MHHHHVLGQELARTLQAEHVRQAADRRAGRQLVSERRAAARHTVRRRRAWQLAWAVRLIGRPAV